MIRFDIDIEYTSGTCECNGSSGTLAAETALMVKKIFQDLKAKDPGLAYWYRNEVLRLMNGAKTPVWEED